MGRYHDDRDYDDDDYDVPRSIRRDALPHSGVGILSIILAILSFMAFVGVIIFAVILEANGPMVEDDPGTMMIGLLAIGCLGGWLVGLVLALVGTFQTERNRSCPFIGLILNGLFLMGAAALLVVGAMVA